MDMISPIRSCPRNSKLYASPMIDSWCYKVIEHLDMQEHSIKTHNFHSIPLKICPEPKMKFFLQILKKYKCQQINFLSDMLIDKKQFGSFIVQLKNVQFNGKIKLIALLSKNNFLLFSLPFLPFLPFLLILLFQLFLLILEIIKSQNHHHQL